MLVLSATEVRQALPMDATIRSMMAAFAALSAGRAEIPLRARVAVPKHEGVSLFMPAYFTDETGEALAIKAVSVFPGNLELGIPTIHAAVLVLEAATGRPVAQLEGGALTAIRTGAASGAATELLSRPESSIAAIFGAGVQARTQLEAVCTVRRIEQAWIYDPNFARTEAFISDLAGYSSIPADLRAAATPQEAVADADVICTATTSKTPVFADKHLKGGVHINAVGSYTPDMQEISSETVVRSRVVVDSRDASLAESGDLIQPIRQGTIRPEHVYAELGEIALRRKPGRHAAGEITLFKSVGVAVQDAAAAQLALENARRLGLGTQVDW